MPSSALRSRAHQHPTPRHFSRNNPPAAASASLMSFASDESLRVLLLPAEKPSRAPVGCAAALAAGQTLWLLSQLTPRLHTWSPSQGGRGRAVFLSVAPELGAFLAGATVLLVFWLARRLGGAWAGVLAAAAFVLARSAGLGDAYGSSQLQTVAMALLLAGAWRALRFSDDASVVNGLAAGAVLGALPAFSRTGTVGALAIVGWLIWQARPHWRSGSVVVGFAAPVAWLLSVRGAELASSWAGYFRFVREHTRRLWSGDASAVWSWLPDARGGMWLIFALLGLAGVVALLGNWRRRADGVLLASVAAAMLLFLALGRNASWPGQFWVLPVPFLIAAGACLVVRTFERDATGPRLVVGGALAAQLVLGITVGSDQWSRRRSETVAKANVRSFAEQNLPSGALIIGPSSLAGGVQPGGKWQFVDARLLGSYRGGSGRPRSSSSATSERRTTDARERQDLVWHELQAHAQGAPVYWITRSTASVDRALHGRAAYEVVGEFTAPAASPPSPARPGPRRPASATAPRPPQPSSRSPEAPQTLKVVRVVFGPS